MLGAAIDIAIAQIDNDLIIFCIIDTPINKLINPIKTSIIRYSGIYLQELTNRYLNNFILLAKCNLYLYSNGRLYRFEFDVFDNILSSNCENNNNYVLHVQKCNLWFYPTTLFFRRIPAWSSEKISSLLQQIEINNVKQIFHGNFKLPLASDVIDCYFFIT